MNVRQSEGGEFIEQMILSVLVIVAAFVIGGIFFDFYYDLNDDYVIKDIMAGAYTGVPNGYTNQLLYPLSWLISICYRLFREFPVYGVFLCGCYSVCIYLIVFRSLSFCNKEITRIAIVILNVLIILSLFLRDFIFIQYTVVSGVLAATACFVFYTTPQELPTKEFWKKNIPALLLAWVSFLLRSEMLLLMCPFLAIVGWYHWQEETRLQIEKDLSPFAKPKWKHLLSKENRSKYIAFAGVFLLGLGICFGADMLAYGNPQWGEFREFFDARTTVYDFTWYPSYEEQPQFYEEAGISKVQYTLIDNYNFGLDETIDTHTLRKVASYGEKQHLMGSFGKRIKNAVWELVHRTVTGQDAPYNLFVLAGYGLVIGLAFLQKNRQHIEKLILLLIMRNIGWMYILLVGRAVERITHPLYFAEFLILMGILCKELYDRPLWNLEKYYRCAVLCVLLLLSVVTLPSMWNKVSLEQTHREEILANQHLLERYAKEHPENYYYLDVYSTVAFSEKMFEQVDNYQKNYDLAGGWICGSPLQQQIWQKYIKETSDSESNQGDGLEDMTMAKALLQDNFFFVIEQSADKDFLIECYEEKGKQVELQLVDTLGEGENPFQVYKIEEVAAKKKNR